MVLYYAGHDKAPNGLDAQGIKMHLMRYHYHRSPGRSGLYDGTEYASIGPTLIHHNMTANGSMQSSQFLPQMV